MIIENTKEITHTVKDTIYKIEADSSYYYAFVDCISGKPVLREPVESKSKPSAGKTLKIPDVKLDGNLLSIECYQTAQEFYKQWRETYIKEHEQTPIYIDKPVEVETPLTSWQKTQIWFGRIFIGILSIFIIIGVLRWKSLI